ncbi:SusC/RagA family TonB-linked outer membrane protein [Pedobacter sp. KBW06]|nr:SusC/RagA family TonB-linked outer membrane protein [Pedobacter sp. KBW06]
MYKNSTHKGCRLPACAMKFLLRTDKKKILMRINLVTALLIAGMAHVGAAGFAQRVLLHKKNMALEEVFIEFRKQTGYDFLWQPDQLNALKTVDIDLHNQPLETALKSVLAGHGLVYIIKDKTVIIRRDENLSQRSRVSADPPVKGKVLDEMGIPLPNASILIKGKTEVFKSNEKGEFSFNVPEDARVLVFRYVGYQNKEVEIGGKKDFVVRLEPEKKSLTEVVINGISERPKEIYTGAITTLSAADLKKVSAQNVLSAVSAMDPSFRIIENNTIGSNINALPDIQIRGGSGFPDIKGSYTGKPNQPLFIMDGFEVPLQRVFDLDMNRIASVSLLKDAAATAIYGSRGANGVMVIETIKPKRGKLSITYNNDFKLSMPDLSDYNLLNAKDKLALEKSAGLFGAEGDDYTQVYDEQYNIRLKAVTRGVNTDWLAQPVRTGYSDRNTLYAEGGDDFVRYGLQFTKGTERGVMKGSDRTNYSGEFSISYQFEQFKFRNSLTVNTNKANNSPYGNFAQYTLLNPYWSIYDDEGRIKTNLDEGYFDKYRRPSMFANPIYNTTLRSKDFTSYQEFVNNFSAEWFVSRALRFVANLSLTKQSTNSDEFYSAQHSKFAKYPESDFFRRGSYTIRNGKMLNYEGNLAFNFGKSFGKHTLYAAGGVNIADNSTDFNQFTAEGFPNDRLADITFAKQYELNGKPSGLEEVSRRIGFFSNANYAYMEKYLLDASFRMDGSSQFGAKNRFGKFWSVGTGWNMHKEAFMSGLKFVNKLKIRASYGSQGGLNVPAYQAMTTYSYFTNLNYRVGVGAFLLALGDENLKWQNKLSTNAGADFLLFNERLDISVNYYHDLTQNALADITTPPSVGFGSYKANFGELVNNGFEITSRFVILKQNTARDFYLGISASGVQNRNKIQNVGAIFKKLNADQDKGDQTAPKVRLEEGYSVNTIWAVPSKGIDPSNGKEVFVKKDGSLTNIWDPADKQAMGNLEPDLEGRFGTFAGYKGFNLNVIFSYKFGNQVYNSTLIQRVENVDPAFNTDRRVYEQRWKSPGDLTFYKDVKDKTITKTSSRFIQNESVFALQSASLSYDFEQKFLQKIRLQNLRLSFYMNDIFRISTVKQERGLNYPFARSVSFSLRTTL